MRFRERVTDEEGQEYVRVAILPAIVICLLFFALLYLLSVVIR